MTPNTFKERFKRLSIENQQTAINEMEKAVPKDYLTGVPPDKHDEAVKAFGELLVWCKANKKEPISKKS